MAEKRAKLEHVIIETVDAPERGITGVAVGLGPHMVSAAVTHHLPFYEWRVQRAIRKLTDLVFMMARQEDHCWNVASHPEREVT